MARMDSVGSMDRSLGEIALSEFSRPLVWDGFRQMIPIATFVLVFGAAFGLAAVQAGVASSWAIVMSATVFAGAAQFAVLDLWGPTVPLIALAVTVFAINARHLLMGASLYPWLRHLPPLQRYGAMALSSDANWAMCMQAMQRGQPGLGCCSAAAWRCGCSGWWACGWAPCSAARCPTPGAGAWTW